jgi:hypothetical protein
MSERLSLFAPDWYRESRMQSSGSSRYSVGSHLLYIMFCYFTGCSPLILGYSVDSHLYFVLSIHG